MAKYEAMWINRSGWHVVENGIDADGLIFVDVVKSYGQSASARETALVEAEFLNMEHNMELENFDVF